MNHQENVSHSLESSPSLKAGFFKRFFRLLSPFLCIFVGVIAPLAALTVESSTRLCSVVFFDPLPTVVHIGMIALVSVTNALLFMKRFRHSPWLKHVLPILCGSSLVTTALYALLFLPILPVAILYTALSFGALFLPAAITLLPLAPLASCVATLVGTVSCHLQADRTHFRKRLSIGALLALGVFAAVEFPRTITRIELTALSNNPSDAQALERLRRWGDSNFVLESAYRQTHNHADFLDWIQRSFRSRNLLRGGYWQASPIPEDVAQRAYFQMTGESFDSVPTPAGHPVLFDFFGVDRNIGQQSVGAKSPQLFLKQSQIDTSLDESSFVSYTEWTMEFRNDASAAAEARAEILLPEGGAVTRATLWIDGQEREAAFGERGKTVRAYQKVVQRRRDPLLVTSSGKNRVLIQCFPIPASGGEMKIRIGITAPLLIDRSERGITFFPTFTAQNFEFSPELTHRIWLESKSRLSTESTYLKTASAAAQGEESLFRLRGEVPSHSEILGNLAVLTETKVSTAPLRFQDSLQQGQVWERLFEKTNRAPAKRLVFVIDSSQKMKEIISDLMSAFQHFESKQEVAVILASDTPMKLTNGFLPADSEHMIPVAEALRRSTYLGGTDNSLALLEALELAESGRDTTILWIHGPQPIELNGLTLLEQYHFRKPHSVQIRSFQVEPGRNIVLSKFDGENFIEEISRAEINNRSVAQIISGFTSGASAQENLNWESVYRELPQGTPIPPTLLHASKLRALQAVLSLSQSGNRTATEQAVKVATDYQLVTPVSGAVVLENAEQYQENNLSPTAPGAVPIIPEPGIIKLLFVLAALFLSTQMWNLTKRTTLGGNRVCK